MGIVPKVVGALQQVFTVDAEAAARQSGFCRRGSKLGGAAFTQAVVLTCLGQREPTLEQYAQTAAACGQPVQPQAFDQRFNAQAAACLQQVLARSVQQALAAEPAVTGLLARFTGVYLCDSTVITLPAALEADWPGAGNRHAHGTQAALKCQVQFELRSGCLRKLTVEPGKASDQRSTLQEADLPAGALRLADLGYFDLDVLDRLGQARAYWLTRLQPSTAVFGSAGKRLDLARWLGRQRGRVVDVAVLLGARHRLPCRLIAIRVPPAVAARRRERLCRQSRRRGKQQVSAERLALCAWTILLTNVPVELLQAHEAVVLARTRWQIELLFKLWKSDGGLEVSRSAKPYRQLCEIFGKLIACVVQHWVLLVSSWSQPARSLRKAVGVVRQQALLIARGLREEGLLVVVIEVVSACVEVCAHINVRRNEPHTYQLLEDPTLALETLA